VFRHCRFVVADMDRASLAGATLEDCYFHSVLADRSDWTEAKLVDSKLHDFTPASAAMEHVRMQATAVDFSHFQSTALNGSAFENLRWFKSGGRGSAFDHAVFREVVFTEAIFRGCSMRGARFDSVDLRFTRFVDCDLSDTMWSGVTTGGYCSFEGSRLKGAEMPEALRTLVQETGGSRRGSPRARR